VPAPTLAPHTCLQSPPSLDCSHNDALEPPADDKATALDALPRTISSVTAVNLGTTFENSSNDVDERQPKPTYSTSPAPSSSTTLPKLDTSTPSDALTPTEAPAIDSS
jgi:hypothetical protein